LKRIYVVSVCILVLLITSVFVWSGLTQGGAAILINTTEGSLNAVNFSLTNLNTTNTNQSFLFSSVETMTAGFLIPINAEVISATFNITGQKRASMKRLDNITIEAPVNMFILNRSIYIETQGVIQVFNITSQPSISIVSNSTLSSDLSCGRDEGFVVNSKKVLLISCSRGTTQGIYAFNFSNTSNITEMGNITFGVAKSLQLYDNNTLILVDSTNDAVHTLNVSDANNMVMLSNISGDGAPYYLDSPVDAWLDNDVIYVVSAADNSLSTFNITDLSNIAHMDSIFGASSPNFLNIPIDVLVDNDITFVTSEIDDTVRISRISIFNTTDPSNITLIRVFNGSDDIFLLENILSMGKKGDILYVAGDFVFSSEGSLSMINVSNISDIRLIDNVQTPSNQLRTVNEDILIDGNDIVYTISTSNDYFSVFNSSASYPEDVFLSAGILSTVIFNNTNTMNSTNTTIDLASEMNGYITGKGNITIQLVQPFSGLGKAVLDNVSSILYTFYDNKIKVWNISTKGNIILIDTIVDCAFAPGNCPFGGIMRGGRFALFEDRLFVNNLDCFSIFNVSDPSDVEFVGNASNILPGIRPDEIEVDNNLALVFFEDFTSGINDTLIVLNVTNSSNVTILSNITDGVTNNSWFGSERLRMIDDVVYITSSKGLTSYNISNPSNITKISNFQSAALINPENFDIKGDIAYFSNDYKGDGINTGAISMVNISNPSSMVLVANITYNKLFGDVTHSPSHTVAFDGNILYTGVDLGLLMIFALNITDLNNIHILYNTTRVFTELGQVTTELKFYNDALYATGSIDQIGGVYELSNTLCTTKFPNMCEVSVTIGANGGGVSLSDIKINYTYNVTHGFTRNDTYTWNKTTDVLVNSSLKRRYSIQPTSERLSNNFTTTGYYLRNNTASQCEFDNVAKTVTTNYCAFVETVSQSNFWPIHYIWDNNISTVRGVELTTTDILIDDILYKNQTVIYRDPADLSAAPAGLFINATHDFSYNDSISQNQKIEFFDSGTWYDITPTAIADCQTTPTYTRQEAAGRVFHVCLSTDQRYVSYKIEESV